MIERALAAIVEADLLLLIERGRTEGRRLDFKRDLPGGGESEVREFLADVTSFANGDGGDIVIGMEEDGNGTASALPGVPTESLDSAILAMEARVRDCVDARLPAFHVHAVPLASGRAALVLRIPASLLAPHRAVYGKISRFHGRNSRGKFEMDTTELRTAFDASGSVPQRLRALHDRAVALSQGGDLPCVLERGPTMVMTVTPLSVLREARDVRFVRETAVLPPNAAGGIFMTPGLDGYVVHAQIGDDPRIARAWSYNHRRGYVDMAWVIGRTRDDRGIVWRRYVDEALIAAVRASVARLTSFGIDGPWVVMATLINVRGFAVITGDDHLTSAAWQDPAFLGQITDDHLEPTSLKPMLDAFWRVFGVDDPPGLPESGSRA